ncbi:phosphogluconate dehydratase [Duganella sp. BJB488]|uniref:Phosphogluconate dehydratase n=1 Tax=Duganella vulcania TaxID=2692166 RepID=A0A845G863_9BURK|nr:MULTISPECIES: phosphogluconate dehydratase [Duganella]MYM90883.1 phosphogluconate dehydratase [Duganella vulcania]NVD73785.1 phosphogluconate dehydratase [Duganella sp. BJB1802]RFP25834.1 phosphogluconate dehydratase [Duganella sp. BJB489]RFP28425.1 phosphogluconate dehydratase [Duganella sp. BJB488]RFP36765.1 phosphogluconate dehydratase [Duganella sp. BJB480]
MALHPVLETVTARIIQRSKPSRGAYLAHLEAARVKGVQRGALACTNLAHGFAAFPANDKLSLKELKKPSVAIVSAYNDMLSAHQPFEGFPALIKDAVRDVGAVAQFAGGTPAMCDGVTQGQPGMELSLFSRDAIAMATAVALSHNMFDSAVYLGVCDKIVPGLLIGALHFGHLPAVFVPAGPMTTGLSNSEKAKIRQLYAQGKVGRAELLEGESQSYHSAGTCTFYGTANSNQMLMEVMGLHLPGAAFITPNTPLRDELTKAAARRAAVITAQSKEYLPVGHVVDEKSIVNAIVALLTTGGSTNHTLHLVAIAKAAGIVIDWNDFDELSKVVPLLTRIYPNGNADVNHFHAAGGTGFVIRELLDGGLLHDDVTTILGKGLRAHCAEPFLGEGGKGVVWKDSPTESGDEAVLRKITAPFSPDGGTVLVQGNLGRAVMKVSAVKPEHQTVEAPALTFNSQEDFMDAYKAGQLDRDFVAVLRFQGPRANGMPELHALTPALANLQDAGRHVALVTDGRMSGASGKVPAAIHVSPEILAGGPLGLVRDGDIIRVCARTGTLEALVESSVWHSRSLATADLTPNGVGMGRELFAMFRNSVCEAEKGATTFALPSPIPTTVGLHDKDPVGNTVPGSDEDYSMKKDA